jgi:hypothetical protein
VEAEPIFNIEYSGKNIWLIVKECDVNKKQNGSWLYNDITGLIVQNEQSVEQPSE